MTAESSCMCGLLNSQLLCLMPFRGSQTDLFQELCHTWRANKTVTFYDFSCHFFLTFLNQVCWDLFIRLTGNELLIQLPISKSVVVPGDDFGRLKYACSQCPPAPCTSLTPEKHTTWIKPPLPQPIRWLSLSLLYTRSKGLPCPKARLRFIN